MALRQEINNFNLVAYACSHFSLAQHVNSVRHNIKISCSQLSATIHIIYKHYFIHIDSDDMIYLNIHIPVPIHKNALNFA
jgi:hypothetical protein